MTEICDWSTGHFMIARIDSLTAQAGESWWCECLRPYGHAGPHLIKRVERIGGQYVIWEQDCCEPGTCEGCDGEDPEDYCLTFREVDEMVASRLIADGSLES
ncbi:MAG: hypothetical protein V4606_04415 [Patescibacteria group bacterium]